MSPTGVVIFSAVCNRFRVKKIGFVDKFVMSYGGLRGAVAFALVITINIDHIPLQPMFLTATIAMVYFTVFVQVPDGGSVLGTGRGEVKLS
ncbi:putative Na(+)/H(+) antiporter nhx-9 [Portunus trituberculatus]|uniref:Putative Na(+)/H(+) antiporter nhx-9 n=1 Tax=Portunus trituberculatus TaxID=210409 RepID=A0A5B7JB30_PORTR|nr:putative Na(+)/H(+) antiporter nhx-9 [Portunus trituberculatus]